MARRETLDPTPVARPVNWKEPESLQEQIRRFVRAELSERAEAHGQESFEEADDFDVGDDYDPRSPHELDSDVEQLPRWKELEQREAAVKEAEEKIAKRQAAALKARERRSKRSDPPAGGDDKKEEPDLLSK